MSENISKKWAEHCAKSGKTSFVLPPELLPEADALANKEKDVVKMAEEFNRANNELDIMGKSFWHKVREFCTKQGAERAFSIGVGYDKDAEAEGIRVVNLTNER